MARLNPRSAPALLALLALCALVSTACQRTGPHEATPSADPGAPPPSLSVNLVEHAPAQLSPSLDWRRGAVARSPMKLSTGDGAGLRLVSVESTVVIDDPLVFTELRLSFQNPENRRREGRFEFELPAKATLSRLAMKIGRRWMEGEVVERAAARETFESYIHERPKVDPALLETAGANRVAARVFPILPHERKEIIVSYSQPLEGGLDELRLPLAGLPALEHLDVRVLTDDAEPGAQLVELHERDFEPSGDLVVALEGSGEASAVAAGELAAIRVGPQMTGELEDFEALTILFDTSASAALRFDAEVDRLGEMLETLGEMPVRVLAFDQTVELIHDGPASAMLGAPITKLRERRAFGASNLDAALRSEALAVASGGRLLIWSDGEATAGATDPASLTAVARGLALGRIDAFASSAAADRELLTALTAEGDRAGFVVGPDLAGTELLGALGRAGFDGVEIEVAGATWSYPATLEGHAPGEDLVVYARFPSEVPATVEVGFSDPRLPSHRIPTAPGPTPLVERAVARAEVGELQARLNRSADPSTVESLREQLIDKALRNRILTPHTALLVLESEAEYRRHGIDRHARADILTVGAGGVELLSRGGGPSGRRAIAFDAPDMAAAAVQAPNALMGHAPNPMLLDGEAGVPGQLLGGAKGGLGIVGTGRGGGGVGEGTIGLGNTGLIGKGGGGGTGTGYGRGSGAGFGGRGKRVPQVRMSKAQVMGSLNADIVRRIVRAHVNEVRHAYNSGLTKDPNLAGRVEVEFTISPSGKVSASSVVSSTLGDPSVGNQIARAVKRWKFPAPKGGGLVIVRYPFILAPDGSGSSSSWSSAANQGRSWNQGWSQGPRRTRRPGDPSDPNGAKWMGSALSGRYEAITTLLTTGKLAEAHDQAWDWAIHEPDNSLALLALATALSHRQEPEQAARVLGSIIDLHPERADMRRAAAARLEAIGAHDIAEDSYRKALAQRPDQINGHRLLAWLLAKQGRHAEAYETIREALAVDVPRGRFRGVKSLLREDLELIAAAWIHAEPEARATLERDGVEPATRASLRVVAHWETDATDVDILVDPIGASARVGKRHADVRTGYGPEAWISSGPAHATAVTARVRYFNRQAMGYALGSVFAISHDGSGDLSFETKPFVLMNARGSIDLGRFGEA